MLVYDPIRGGATLEMIKQDECTVDLLGVFKDRKVIEWHRIKVAAAHLSLTNPLFTSTW